jgi:UDP-N-acetylmuramoyl-tripeptide--D-alanyl-D-alanine ligase
MAALATALGPERVACHTQTAAEMGMIVRNDLASGDAVMIKGSNGVGLTGVVETIRGHFNQK